MIESYFQDDPELGNSVTFGMRLIEEVLPAYYIEENIRGEKIEEHSELRNKYDEGAFTNYGSISEKLTKSHSLIY